MSIYLSQAGDVAASGYLRGEPYSKYDCQGYLKAVLRKAGLTRAETDWPGTNGLWRDDVSEAYLIRDYPIIPYGAVLLSVRYDEKPPAKYPDGPNCAHCGVYIGNGAYWHSSSGGVQWDKRMERFNYWAILKHMYRDEPVKQQNALRLEGVKVEANKIKVTYKEADGTEDYEILELNDTCNVTSVEIYLDSTE